MDALSTSCESSNKLVNFVASIGVNRPKINYVRSMSCQNISDGHKFSFRLKGGERRLSCGLMRGCAIARELQSKVKCGEKEEITCC